MAGWGGKACDIWGRGGGSQKQSTQQVQGSEEGLGWGITLENHQVKSRAPKSHLESEKGEKTQTLAYCHLLLSPAASVAVALDS